MATDATLRIKIGVSVDADASRVFEPIERASARARKRVKDNLDAALKTGGTGGIDNPYRESARRTEKANSQEIKNAMRKYDVLRKVDAEYRRELEANSEKSQRAAERRAQREVNRNQRIADASALRMSGGSVRDIGRGLNAARGVAMDMARGAGVNMDFGSLVKQNVDLESRATKLSNASWDYKGGAQARTSGADIMGTVQSVAAATGSDMSDVLGAMENFVGKTGDLQTARDSLMEMAKISKATGASLADMMNSSGDIAIQLGDAAGKGEVLAQVAKIMAGQGQVGAVEYKDMADGIAVIAAKQGKFKLNDATKGLFAGAGVTSDVAANVGVMGVLTQAVRQSGGKATARQSLNSAQAFIRDLTGGSGLKRMGEFGIDPFADKEKTTLRDPKELILEMLKKTGGDQKKLARLLPNQNSRAVVDAFSNDYIAGANAAKKSGEKDPEIIAAAGAARAAERFDKLAQAAMSNSEVEDKFNSALQTTESKANQFNVELAKIASATGQKLVPALMKLAPTILQAADSMGKIVGWATENPRTAIISMVGAAIAKNIGQEMLRATIEKSIVGRLGAIVGPAGASSSMVPGFAGAGGAAPAGAAAGSFAAMGLMGTVTAALAIGTIAVTTFQIGKAVINEMIANKTKEVDKSLEQDTEALNVYSEIKAKERQQIAAGVVEAQPWETGPGAAANSPDIAALYKKEEEAYNALAEKESVGQKGPTDFFEQVSESTRAYLANLIGMKTKDRSWDAIDKDNASADTLTDIQGTMKMLEGHFSRELNVKVTNMPKGNLPGMPPGSVTPASTVP